MLANAESFFHVKMENIEIRSSNILTAREKSNTWLYLHVLVSSKCCHHGTDLSKTRVEVYMKGETNSEEMRDKITVKLHPIKSFKPEMVNYALFEGKIQLWQHWLEGKDRIRYCYKVNGNKESHPKDVKKRRLSIPTSRPLDTSIHHYDYPVYMHDELESTSRNVDSLIEDRKVSTARRDAQLTYLTFLPLLKSIQNYDPVSRDYFAAELDHIIGCLCESGNSNGRMPKNFDHKQVLQQHLMESFDIKKAKNQIVFNNTDTKHHLVLTIMLCKLINHYKLELSMTEQQIVCSQLALPDVDEQDIDEITGFIDDCFHDAGSILQAFIQTMSDSCYDWLFVLPLVHFLRRDCKPFGAIVYDREACKNPRFWGIHDLNRTNYQKDTRLHETKNKEFFLSILKKLKSSFKMDPLLLRSCLWLQLNPKGIVSMLDDVDVAAYISTCPAVLCSAISIMTLTCCKTSQETLNRDQLIIRILDVLLKTVHSAQDINLNSYQSVVENIQRNVALDQYRVVQKASEVFIAAFLRKRVIDEASESDMGDETYECLKVVTALVGVWILSNLLDTKLVNSADECSFADNEEPQIWDSLYRLSDRFIEDDSRTIWNEEMNKHQRARIRNGLSDTKILLLFCHDHRAQKNHVFQEEAIAAVQELLEVEAETILDSDCESFFQLNSIDENFCSKMSEVFLKKFHSFEPISLVHIVAWAPFVVFLKIQVSGRTDILSLDCEVPLLHLCTIFEDYSKAVMDGSITIGELKPMVDGGKEYQKQFIELYMIQAHVQDVTVAQATQEDIQHVLVARKQELLRFETEVKQHVDLQRFCDKFCPVNTDEIKRKLKSHKHDMKKLNEVCVPTTLGGQQYQHTHLIQSGFFNHPHEVRDMIQPLLLAIRSPLIYEALQTKAKQVLNEKETGDTKPLLSLFELATKVWQPVHGNMARLVEELRDESISLEKININFRQLDNLDNLKQEIDNIFRIYGQQDAHDLVESRCHQISSFFHLSEYTDTAKQIMELKNEYKLNGDFAPIQQLLELSKSEKEDVTLASMSQSVMQLVEQLKKVSEENQLQCFDLFSDQKSKDLTMWIRKEVEDLSELEVFVDLAAGDTDAEFTSVLKLHHAATGYAAFIFDLKETSDWKSFAEVIERLAFANKDSALPSQWQETKDNLSDLILVRKAMDSSPLQQAEMINERGVYTIGKVEPMQKCRRKSDDLVSLVLEVVCDGRRKIYTKDDLQDLQSKLSLVVGKAQQESKDGDGKKHMEYFGEVFNAMQFLANTYNKLCSAGNTLFLESKATFNCDFKRNASSLGHSVCMEFGPEEKIFGTRSLREELPDLLKFMNKCVNRWNDHVDSKRERHYYLNFFTTKQLLRLCRGLATHSQHTEKDHDFSQLYALLSTVTHEPSWTVIQSSLKRAMSSATKEILEESQIQDDTDEVNEDVLAARRQKSQEIASRISSENMMDDDVRVLAAINALGTDLDDDEYLSWCFEHPAGKEGEKPIHSFTKSWKEIVKELLSKLNTKESSLDALLSELWDNYIHSVKCVDSDEYLSLDYLGLILKHLALSVGKAEHDDSEDGDSRTRVPSESSPFVHLDHRQDLVNEFHAYFKENRPNLVICGTRDILTTVLSIYRGGLLPTHEEVLICSPGTTFEEVSLLWRRAIGDRSDQRVFCLVHAERLEYETSVKAANLLNELTQKPTGCRLVILCSLEEEHRAHMVTKLDQYRVELPAAIFNNDDIEKYLHQQLHMRAAQVALMQNRNTNDTDVPTPLRSPVHSDAQDGVLVSHVENEMEALQTTPVRARNNISSFLSFADTSILTSASTKGINAASKSDSTQPLTSGSPQTLNQEKRGSTVHAIVSHRSGVGKSTVITSYVEYLKAKHQREIDYKMCITIPLHDKRVDNDEVVEMLLPHLKTDDSSVPRVFHLDAAPMVHDGLDELLFNLLVLGGLTNEHGKLWKYQPTDIFIIEITDTRVNGPWFHTLLPHVRCYAPKETLRKLASDPRATELSEMDLYGDSMNIDSLLLEPQIQRAVQYLDLYSEYLDRHTNLEDVEDPVDFTNMNDQPEFSFRKILDTLLSRCGVFNPSWAELRNFAHFLSAQLSDCEQSDFCQPAMMDVHSAFSTFKSCVVELMVTMAQDFSTPSLDLSDISSSSEVSEYKSKTPEHLRKTSSESDTTKSSISCTPSSVPVGSSPLSFSPVIEDGVIKGIYKVDESSDDELAHYQLKRRWEKCLHPYIFFNEDHVSFTFMGFVLDESGKLISKRSEMKSDEREVNVSLYGKRMMNVELMRLLSENGFNLTVDFDELTREDKLLALYRVLGLTIPATGLEGPDADPDTSYKLTADNVMKMLAIYMRFRCEIPVVIMGETGCGKTRLIQYMCQLLAKKNNSDANVENLILEKVHGGTAKSQIGEKVEAAEKLALTNREAKVYTVLFLDEANTTEAIGLIKEIMCDGRIQGRRIETADGFLKIIAACNPYRRHTRQMVDRMKQSGLGYRVAAEDTKERLGSIPLRELVYRVQPLPPSIRPLVWDFGTLAPDVERIYIEQIIQDYNDSLRVETSASEQKILVAVLAGAQEFMRHEKHECSFVSLRDVNRCMDVLEWFLKHAHLLPARKVALPDSSQAVITVEEAVSRGHSNHSHASEEMLAEPIRAIEKPAMSDLTRSLVLALGVCYHARLQGSRKTFREHISSIFQSPCTLLNGADEILEEISRCQDEFVKDIDLGPNIAANAALKENVFMMVICIELRIPLFLIGKPGSSKSLAKTIVAKTMQGDHSKSSLYKSLKQVHMLACQCSPLTTSADIIHTFERCEKFQKEKMTEDFVSVVVLDEVGLAEDSPKMPLKTLHPLLEPTATTEEESRMKRVGFIGLSNWALDPAKMNRGIMVLREEPTEEELEETAKGICHSDEDILQKIQELIPALVQGYQFICKIQSRDFFGLRDFYSLIKMVYGFAKTSGTCPTLQEMQHCIMRNFEGFAEEIEPLEIFHKCFKEHNLVWTTADDFHSQPDCSQAGLLKASIEGIPKGSNDHRDGFNISRYLLILTENYAALPIVEQQFSAHRPEVIFGSSFPNDRKYTQICRDINSIKICMEEGQTVILLNFDKLYESLYDALNQYYAYYKDERYVTLGLGTHRVKCKVHPSFRLIVIADKSDVYEHFPSPLINRLEKHFLSSSTMLSPMQQRLVVEIDEWVRKFSIISLPDRSDKCEFGIEEAFVGFHKDLIPTLVFQVCGRNVQHGDHMSTTDVEAIVPIVKQQLLQCATPEAIMRLPFSELKNEFSDLFSGYFHHQKHSSLMEYLQHNLQQKATKGLMLQVTTHSRLLVSKADLDQVTSCLNLREPKRSKVHFMFLQSFQTQQQCRDEVRRFLASDQTCERLLVVQCEDGHRNGQLIACASYCVTDEIFQAKQRAALAGIDLQPTHVILVINLARMSKGFICYHGGSWEKVHIDDLRPPESNRPEISSLVNWKGDQSMFAHPGEVRSESLIKDSLHHAVSRIDVKREEDGDVRMQISKRISTIRSLIEADAADVHVGIFNIDEGEPTFVSVLKERLAKLIEEQERSCGQVVGGMQWLVEKALETSKIQESGTFRRALWQQLINIVSPLLAEVIAYCDYNDNLQLLLDCEENWSKTLWLAIANDHILAPLQYKDMISPVGISEETGNISDRKQCEQPQPLRETIPVKSFCRSGKLFTATSPFSWLIKKAIDCKHDLSIENKAIRRGFRASEKNATSAQRGSEPVNQESPDLATRHMIEDMFEAVQSELRATVGQNVPPSAYNKYIDGYLKDFIQMAYICGPKKELQEHELECVACAMKAAMIETSKRLQFFPEQDVLRGLVLIHATYSEITGRLEHFSKLVHAYPQLLEKYHDKLTNQEDEMLLDVKAVEILVGDLLTPRKEECKQPKLQELWLNKVQKVKLLIQTTINAVTQKKYRRVYGSRSRMIINELRPKWYRIQVLEIFYINMLATSQFKVHPTITSMGLPVWNAFPKGANLKNIETIKRVKTVLENITKAASKIDFEYGLMCAVCFTDVTSPVYLKCKHALCKECVDKMHQQGLNTCPTCKQNITESSPEFVAAKQKAFKKFKDFKERRNTFFFEIVSQLCFSDNTGPDSEVVEGLLKLVVGYSSDAPQQKGVTFNTDCIDHTPAIRMVILRLLLQSNEDATAQFLDNHLRSIRPGTGEDLQLATQVCLMFVYFYEDLYLRQTSCSSDQELSLIEEATRRLTDANDRLKEQPGVPDAKLLETIAEARFGLKVTAQFLHKISKNPENLEKNKALHYLFEAAQMFCLDTVCKQQAHLFLVKNLCKSFSSTALDFICQDEQLKWILDDQLRERLSKIDDTFVVCGTSYVKTRDALYQSMRQQLMIPMIQAQRVSSDRVKSLGCSEQVRKASLLLALFREITLDTHQNDQMGDQLVQFIHQNTDQDLFKDLTCRLVENNVRSDICDQLVVRYGESRECMRTRALALHTLVVFLSADDHHPCWPLKLLLKQEKLDGKENAFVGAIRTKYNLASVRETVTSSDTEAVIFKIILRIFLLGVAVYNPKMASKVITPKSSWLSSSKQNAQMPEGENAGEQVWNALKEDMLQIERLTKTNAEACICLIHAILAQITDNQMDPHPPDEEQGTASELPRYEDWEEDFIARFITPYVQNLEITLHSATQEVQKDRTAMIMDHLRPVEPELSITDHKRFGERFICLSELWQYKMNITVQTVKDSIQELYNQKPTHNKYKLLQEFLRKEPILRAMKELPDIILLQRRLIERFHRCIDTKEAEQLRPDDIANGGNGDDMRQLMISFVSAWNQVWTKMTLRDEDQHSLDMDHCNLATFLPTCSRYSISTKLVEFMIETHNNFMEAYGVASSRDKAESVSPSCTTLTHLVAYDFDKDILPLIQAHCYYNFQQEDTSATFNLDSLERAIEETFVRGRPYIGDSIPKLIFREGFRSARVFEEIRSKVKPQERLSSPFKQDILTDMKSITEVCDCLAVVDIAIGFLVTTGGDPDMRIIEYLESSINLPEEQRSQINAKAKYCRLKNILDLWQILGVERAKRRLASRNQDPFDGVAKRFREGLSPDEKSMIGKALRYMDVELFIYELYEYIEIHLKTINPEGDCCSSKSLLFQEITKYTNAKDQKIPGLRRATAEIKSTHLTIPKAVETWKLAVNHQRGVEQKQKDQVRLIAGDHRSSGAQFNRTIGFDRRWLQKISYNSSSI